MAEKSVKNMSVKEAHQRAWWPLVIFFVVVIILGTGLFIYYSYTQDQQHNSIKSFVFSSSTGPVSPQFQASKTLTFSSTQCTYTVTVVIGDIKTNTPCSINQSQYNKIVDSYVNNKIEQAMTNNNNRPVILIGGPEKKMTVNQQNGTNLQTSVMPSFKTAAQPFFNTVQQYVPQFSELNF